MFFTAHRAPSEGSGWWIISAEHQQTNMLAENCPALCPEAPAWRFDLLPRETRLIPNLTSRFKAGARERSMITAMNDDDDRGWADSCVSVWRAALLPVTIKDRRGTSLRLWLERLRCASYMRKVQDPDHDLALQTIQAGTTCYSSHQVFRSLVLTRRPACHDS